MAERVEQRWTVGPYTFEEVSGHPFEKLGPLMYRYTVNGQRVDSELYASLDRAMVSAVGARRMGPRGASGNAVGTAADWFCVMVGIPEDEQRSEPAPDGSAPEQDTTRKRWCPGRGRRWANVRQAAACPVCHQRPEDMDAERPMEHAGGWHGLIPDHLMEAPA